MLHQIRPRSHEEQPWRAYSIAIVIWILPFIMSTVSCKSSSHGNGIGTTTCNPGYVAVGNSCAKLCEADSECPSGNICGSGTLTEICVVGQRTDAPVIESIDGDGTPNGAAGEFAHHLKHAIIVTGQHFEGVDVTLAAPGGAHADVTVTARSPQQLTVALPVSVVDEGTYHLVVHGGAGDSTQSFQIMRGEVGETGFPGATYITRGVLYGTTNLTDATTVAIMVDNPNNQISDSHHFPAGGAAGVMLTAINRINHTLVTSLPAGSWFADPNGSAALVAALNDLTEDTFVLLASRGNVSAWLRDGNGAETALATLLKQFGAAPGVHLLASTEAFVFAGRKGLSAGNGVFIAGTASASTSVSMVDNDIIGASSVNYGVCVRDNANCTIPVDRIVGSGTLALDKLPNGLAGLTVTSSGESITITNSGGVTTSGPLSAPSVSTSAGNISTTTGAISTTSGNFSTTSGNFSTTSGAVSAATAAFTSNVTIGGDLTIAGNVNPTPTTCRMTSTDGMIASTVVYNSHCYGIFNPSTPSTWYAAQLACNSIGAHLATVTTDAEYTALKNLIAANDVEHWIGLTSYEDFIGTTGVNGNGNNQGNGTPRWVGIEGIPTITLATGISLTGTSGDTNRCATVTKNSSSSNTRTCNSTSIPNYICEKRLIPFAQPCASGWWPINGGRLCMDATMRAATDFRTAHNTCQTQSAAAAHVCTYNEFYQACGSGMNPYSQGTTTLTTALTSGWHGDMGNGDNAFKIWNFKGCLNDNDGPAADTATSLQYRCCY